MPCAGPSDAECRAMEADDNGKRYGVRASDRMMLQQFVCETMKFITKSSARDLIEPLLSDGLKKWWEDHEQEDRIRRQALAEERVEALDRKAALAKLSPADRRVLGI